MLLSLLLNFAAAWLALDLLTGIYHYATDRGWNFRSQVEQFQEHHQTNTMDRGYGWEQLVGSLAGGVLAWLFDSSFFAFLGLLSAFAQVPHYYAHHPPASGPIAWLQRVGIFISPQHHAAHHSGEFDRNFCIFTGWNDWWLNWLVAPAPLKWVTVGAHLKHVIAHDPHNLLGRGEVSLFVAYFPTSKDWQILSVNKHAPTCETSAAREDPQPAVGDRFESPRPAPARAGSV